MSAAIVAPGIDLPTLAGDGLSSLSAHRVATFAQSPFPGFCDQKSTQNHSLNHWIISILWEHFPWLFSASFVPNVSKCIFMWLKVFKHSDISIM